MSSPARRRLRYTEEEIAAVGNVVLVIYEVADDGPMEYADGRARISVRHNKITYAFMRKNESKTLILSVAHLSCIHW